MATSENMIRAVFRTVAVPGLNSPHNVVSTKIYYPAIYGDTLDERNTGSIPVDSRFGQMPVLIMTPGVNLDPTAYEWLARFLAKNGVITVLYHMISEVMPGDVNLTPGLDIAALSADGDSDKSAGIAYAPILELLNSENGAGVLAGALDLNNIWFGGHSAGGSTALMSGSKDWFPGLQGVISYAAHTGMSTMMGYAQGFIKPIPDIPVLIIGGTQDGCIANSAHRYGDQPGDAVGRVIKTFEEGVWRSQNDSVLALLDGANHFTFGHPIDHSTGRSFIDLDETCDGESARALMAKMILAFIRKDTSNLNKLLDDPLVTDGRIK